MVTSVVEEVPFFVQANEWTIVGGDLLQKITLLTPSGVAVEIVFLSVLAAAGEMR